MRFDEYSLKDITQNGISDLTAKHLGVRYGEDYTWRIEYAMVAVPADFMEVKILIFPTFSEGQPVDFGRTFRHTSGRYSVILRFYHVSQFCDFKNFEKMTPQEQAQALTQILESAECRVHSDDPSFFYQGCWEDLSKIHMNIYQFPAAYAGKGIWTRKHAVRNGQPLSPTDPRYYFHVTKHIAQIAKDRADLVQPIMNAIKGRIMESIKHRSLHRLTEITKEEAVEAISKIPGKEVDTDAFMKFLQTSEFKSSGVDWNKKLIEKGFKGSVVSAFVDALTDLKTDDYKRLCDTYFNNGGITLDETPGVHSLNIKGFESLYKVTNRSNTLNRVGYGEVLLSVLADMHKNTTGQTHYDLQDSKGKTYEVKSGVAMLANGGNKAAVITAKRYTELFDEVFKDLLKGNTFLSSAYPSLFDATASSSMSVIICDLCMASADTSIDYSDHNWLEQADNALSSGITPQNLPGWKAVDYLFANNYNASSNHVGTRNSVHGGKRTSISSWALDSTSGSTTYQYLKEWLTTLGFTADTIKERICYFIELIYRERFSIAMVDFLGKKGTGFSKNNGASVVNFGDKIEKMAENIINSDGKQVPMYLAELDFIIYATYSALDNAPDSNGYMATQNKKQFDYILFMDLAGSDIKYVNMKSKTSKDVADNLGTEIQGGNLVTSKGYTNGNNSNVAIHVNKKK